MFNVIVIGIGGHSAGPTQRLVDILQAAAEEHFDPPTDGCTQTPSPKGAEHSELSHVTCVTGSTGVCRVAPGVAA